MQRKRPKSLEAPVYQKLRQLELYAYVRGDAWKKSYRYTLIDEYMKNHPFRELLKYLTRIIYLAATKDHLKNMSRPNERPLLDPQKNIYKQPYYIGVPIGNWPSQTSGLILTTGPPNYAESLGLLFVHYTDDDTYIITDKEKWREDDQRITSYYKDKLGLTVHPNKKYMQHYSKGVELLGQKLRFNRILPSDRIYHNITWYIDRTIRKASVKTKYAFVYKDKILSSVNSYIGMLRQMNAFKLRRKICKQIETSTLGRVFEISPDFTKITIKKQYSTKTYYKQQYKSLKKQLKP